MDVARPSQPVPWAEEVEAMVQRNLQVVIYREGDGFVAQCLNVDVASDGMSEDQARENLREALELYFDEPDAAADYAPVGDAHLEQLIVKSA
jgi:predicted RNase H-like HicB family nuclease